MIANGSKTIETRTWWTTHRGDLLIVSTKKPIVPGMPSGKALCIVNLVNCRPMIVSDEAAARCPWQRHLYAWVLTNIRQIIPFGVRGYQGLYEAEVE